MVTVFNDILKGRERPHVERWSRSIMGTEFDPSGAGPAASSSGVPEPVMLIISKSFVERTGASSAAPKGVNHGNRN
jgi:hypothetical protein